MVDPKTNEKLSGGVIEFVRSMTRHNSYHVMKTEVEERCNKGRKNNHRSVTIQQQAGRGMGFVTAVI